MKINLFCRMTQSGVGRHAQYLYDNLREMRADVRHVDLDDKNAMAKAIIEAMPNDRTLFFLTQDPKLLQMIRGKKILWCAFESDHIPKRLLALMDAFDEVWALTQWGQRVMIDSGLPQAKTKTVLEGVDAKIYAPNPRAHAGFVFLSVAKYEKRKGIDELIQAFTQEFPAAHYPDVCLKLKADFPLFPERQTELKTKTANDSRIKIIEGYANDEDMAALYNAADAFVFPSRAEGFGLPCLEALFCGLPAIATHYSGQTEYLNYIPDLFLPIDHELENIEDKDFDYFYKDLYAGEPYGHWAKPNVDSLRQSMRQVYEAKEMWKEKALTASRIVRDVFDWKKTAEKTLAELEKNEAAR
ncbi:MAG: glycosyltransferase [Alphaproteobacteria bacterium]|nr:glycosyltransferase [Alphaproteobacteria bacterium]